MTVDEVRATGGLKKVTLEEAVRRAVEALRTEGIDGWGLCISDDDLATIGGRVIVIESSVGCRSETCTHWSHDPAAPWYRWIPQSEDKLVLLSEEYREDRVVAWYVLRRSNGEDIYLAVSRPDHYWASLWVTTPDKIPEWVFQAFVRSQGDE